MKKIRTLLPLALFSFATLVFAKNEVTHSFTSKLPASNVRRVVLELPTCDTTIMATTDSEIRIEGTARREYDGPNDLREEQAIADSGAITMRMRGRNVYVERTFSAGTESWHERNSTKFRFTLYVPEGLPIEIRQKVGNVVLRGNLGDVDAGVSVGDVSLVMPKKLVSELTAISRVGEVTTNLPDRTITKQGVFAGATRFLNDGGKSVVQIKVSVGQVHIDLQ